ncbi:MAG: hypothetical protein HQL31_03545 [Planctomycetes bacterium]|nr:hypothetical protein [Planctomycetota bacterium]
MAEGLRFKSGTIEIEKKFWHSGENAPLLAHIQAGFSGPWGGCVEEGGRGLLVSDSAMTSLGKKRVFEAGKGSISRWSVGSDGHLSEVDRSLVEGLTAPTGIAVLPVATERYPVGTIFVACGSAHAVKSGFFVADREKFFSGIAVIHGGTGKNLGFIDLGPGGHTAQRLGHPALALGDMEFDSEGNLLVCDSGESLPGETKQEGVPGVYRIHHRAIDSLSLGLRDDKVLFARVEDGPSGLCWVGEKKLFLLVTENRGDVYELSLDDFLEDREMVPLLKELSSLRDIVCLPGGTMIISRREREALVVKTDRKQTRLCFTSGEENDVLAGLVIMPMEEGGSFLFASGGALANGNPDPHIRLLCLPPVF